MADVASRSFIDSRFTNSNNSFLTTFNSLFPLKKNSWREFHIQPKIFSKVISCLRGEPLTMALWHKIPGQEKNIGLTGKSTQNCSKKTHTSHHAQMPSKSSLSQLLLHRSGRDIKTKESKSPFKQSLKHFQQSQRPVNWLENLP